MMGAVEHYAGWAAMLVVFVAAFHATKPAARK